MQLKLTHRNHKPSSSITALIEGELAALQPDLRIDEARVAIERSLTESPPFRVSLHLVTPGPDIVVRVKDHTLRAAAAKAFERVRGLCLLLARYCDDGRREITIPGLRDMAAITNLTEETVSRAMSRLRRLGILQRQDRRHGLMLVAAEPAAA